MISTRLDRAHTNSLENISTDKGLTFPGKNRAGSLEYVLPPSIYVDLTGVMKPLCVLLSLAVICASCSVSQDQEVEIGRQNAEEISAQLPIVTDPAISGYIQALGESIARTTSRANLDWHFYVVNSKQVNAFALPGGYIYVNRGLIESADKLDELTGTLGHEIGHVIERHSVKDMQTQQKANFGLAVVCTLTSICHSGLTQVAVQVGGSALFARHSRLDELQADSEGVVNVMRAGYDPQGIPDLFQVLLKQRQYEPTIVEGWFASHPLEEARIAKAKELIRSARAESGERLLVDTPEFHAFKERVSNLPPPPQAPAQSAGP
jgi:beta-barrel assembly-enhancing protease